MPKLRDDKSDCTHCKGKGRIPTDLWENTTAMWEPCHVCHPDDVKLFYQIPDAARLHWFVGPR